MKKTVFHYQKFVGKRKSVSTFMTISERARKVYKVLVVILLLVWITLFLLLRNEKIDDLLMMLILFTSPIPVFAIPIIITVMDKGKEAVRQELKQNKVTEVFDSISKEPVYNKSDADADSPIIERKFGTLNVIDDTDTGKEPGK